MPKDYFEKNGVDYFSRNPVGSGPFKFIRHASGDRIEWEAYDKHYRRVPAFKKFTLMLLPDEGTRIAMLKTGEADVIDVGLDSARDLEAAHLSTVVVGGAQIGVQVYGASDPRNQGKPTADVRVRKALSLAIDRAEIGRTLFNGNLGPVMPPGMGLNQADIDLPYWRAEAAKAYRFDQAEAKRLLQEAGFAQGFNLKVYLYVTGTAVYMPKVVEILQGYWQKIGVKAEIVSLDVAAFLPLRRSGPNRGPADQLVGQLAPARFDEADFPTLLLTAIFTVSGSSGLAQGLIPNLDNLIEGAAVETNNTKRVQMIHEALRLITDSYLLLSLGTVPNLVGVGPRVDIGSPRRAIAIPVFIEGAIPRK